MYIWNIYLKKQNVCSLSFKKYYVDMKKVAEVKFFAILGLKNQFETNQKAVLRLKINERNPICHSNFKGDEYIPRQEDEKQNLN